ncbi:MAG: hypothetical protein HYV29_13275 [Ignavibacteriales bacterium]|nr:hypothetical protein [Ignavibacteriales bacterium]
MKSNTNLFLLFILSTFSLFGQEQPLWVRQQKIESPSLYYYGIGVSKISFDDADARALILFGQNVEIKVKSIFQREVTEEGKEFSEKTNVTEELVSEVSLKGIAISERYADTTAKSFFSLIQYRKTEYDSLITKEIEREILLMKARNKMTEEKRTEALRAEKAKNLQEEEKKKEQLRAQQTDLELKRTEQIQEEQRKELYKKIYGEFLEHALPEKVVTLRNGEIAHETSSLMIKVGVGPVQFKGGYYAFRIAVFEVSGNAIFRDKKFNQQEGFVKVQLLPGVGEFTKTSLAIGVSQAVGLIADSGYSFKRSKYSFFVAANYTDPEWEYTTISAFGDKRRISIGATSFPFFEQFKNHLGFMLEANVYLDKDFRNKYGDSFVINGGIRLQANDSFVTQFAYENNEQFTLSLEFQF